MEQEVSIPLMQNQESLQGILMLPKNATKLVIFAHGSGSSRLSTRNQYVAKVLQQESIASLRVDLLTQEEEKIDAISLQYRFDLILLASRLLNVTSWALKNPSLKHLTIGYVGSSTGAAAALMAAGSIPSSIYAIVCRGGRPDLVEGPLLTKVTAPTLLIVGELDIEVLELNKRAFELLSGEKNLQIVPKATHLFEEEGALATVAKMTAHWFSSHA